jgi:alpha-L-rhamnosidase
MDQPTGIDVTPYWNWKIESEENDTMQTAYQIKLWKSQEAHSIIYDTDKVDSEQSTYVMYQGEPLDSRTIYQVEVTVWDNHGNCDRACTTFETAFLNLSDWKAKWVISPIHRHKSEEGFGKQDPATHFRKNFTLKDKPVSARVYATCHGTYRLSVNGQRVDNREFAPEHTVAEKYLCYQTYDVASQLQAGANAVGLYVGDGWYLCPHSLPNAEIKHAHAVLMQLEVTYPDGSHEIICSDDDMTVSYGPVLASDLYAGELYDANQTRKGWDEAGFDDSTWESAKLHDFGYSNLKAQLGEPVIPVMNLPVAQLLHSPKGETILDFGQVLSGRVSMKIHAPKGTQITLEHCEVLDKEGNYFNNIMGVGGIGMGCNQRDEYICDGSITCYEPYFTFHGFRYVRVIGVTVTESGVKNAPDSSTMTTEDFTAIVLSTQKKDIGSFATSDARINRLYENTRWSQRSNMMSIPTDCPQREKAGWTGDMLVYAKTAMLNEDCTPFFTRWLYNMSCDQDEYGIVPLVMPYDGAYPEIGKLMNQSFDGKGQGTSAGWGDAAVMVPYSMYEVTGNSAILTQQYDTMRRWCDYVITSCKKPAKDSTLPLEIESYLWNTGFHYGEWLIPSQNKNGLDMNNMASILASSLCYTAPIFGWNSVAHFGKIASLLGNESDATHYQAIADKMKHAIQEGVIRKDGSMPSELMGAYVLPLYFDLVPDDRMDAFATHLVKLIEGNNYCLDTGFLGTPYLMDALCKIGRMDLAEKLLWQKQCPSWLFEVDMGATTIWESWYGYQEDGTPNELSFNHYSLGAVDAWMFKTIGGINSDGAGYKNIIIQPKVIGGLTCCRRSYISVYGEIVCDWKVVDDTMHLKVQIPCNTSATVILPDGSQQKVGSGRYEYSCQV